MCVMAACAINCYSFLHYNHLPKRSVLRAHSPLQAKAVMKMPVLEEMNETREELPQGVEDFDQEMKDDPTAVANYANHIFKYYKEREVSVCCWWRW